MKPPPPPGAPPPGAPPPPPPPARRPGGFAAPPPAAAPQQPPARAPLPTEDGFMSTQSKMSLVDIAIALRDEQLQAKVAHYKPELATSPELDAITAQVIAELQQLRAARPPTDRPPAPIDRAQIEIELIQSLKEMLARIFRPDRLSSVFERKLGEVSKRFARIFFKSELHEKIRGSGAEQKMMRYPEQGLYHLFVRNEEFFMKELDSFEWASPQVHERAKARLADYVKELRNDFLARTTPELNALVKYLNEVLTAFFLREAPNVVGELAWEVVKEARLADQPKVVGYKVGAAYFDRFRHAFERRFMQRLISFAEDEMLKRVREATISFRNETLRFVADPQIFSDVCELFCDAVYDLLYNDGFLDLPNDWRTRMRTGG
jgi:hypothetical protein